MSDVDPTPEKPLSLESDSAADEAASPLVDEAAGEDGTQDREEPEAVAEGPVPERRRKPRFQLRSFFFHPVVSAGNGVVALLILCWALYFRASGNPVTVTARETTFLNEVTKTDLSAGAIAQLRERVKQSRDYLVRGDEELGELVTQLEQLSLKQGWFSEVVMEPGIPAPKELEAVVVRPVRIALSRIDDDEIEMGAFQGLMTFLREVKERDKKIQVTSLELQANAGGLQSAHATFHIWTDINHETPAAE